MNLAPGNRSSGTCFPIKPIWLPALRRATKALATCPLCQALAPAFVDPEPLAALYGRADHLRRQEAPLTGEERVALFFRAIYLLLAFAPFLLLGVPLLLVAACLPSQGQSANGTEVRGPHEVPRRDGMLRVRAVRRAAQTQLCAGTAAAAAQGHHSSQAQ